MKRETKLLLGTCLVLLIALPVIATTIVNASGQETDNFNVGAFKAVVGWLRQRFGRFGFVKVQVSEEFKAKAIAIASNDGDVKGLLDNGYSIIGVRSIIQSIVAANGDVTSKATHAIVILKNESMKSFATVWVDLKTESVLKIVTTTRTVINKS